MMILFMAAPGFRFRILKMIGAWESDTSFRIDGANRIGRATFVGDVGGRPAIRDAERIEDQERKCHDPPHADGSGSGVCPRCVMRRSLEEVLRHGG